MGRKIVTLRKGRNKVMIVDNSGKHVADISIADSAHGTRADLCVTANEDVAITEMTHADPARKS